MTCICKYPKIVTTDGGVRYIAMPEDEIVDGIANVPIDYRIEENYVVAIWKRIGPNDKMKEYDLVDNHKAKLGCDVSEQDVRSGNLKCREKQIYEVYHPIDEWREIHDLNFDKCKFR